MINGDDIKRKNEPKNEIAWDSEFTWSGSHSILERNLMNTGGDAALE